VATVHLYVDGEEVASRVMVLKRHVNIESLTSWWRAARRALTGKAVPLEYTKAEAEVSYIRFECGEGVVVMIDRKRSML
jgi:hypothetical protein